MIESQKEYIKVGAIPSPADNAGARKASGAVTGASVEGEALDVGLVDDQFDHAIRSPLSHSVASCTPSTPLPKPGANLRHSISVIGTGNRSSRVLGSMSLGSALEQLQEIEELDATPHAALRRLEGRAGPAPVISQPTCDTDAPHENKVTEEGAQDPQSSSADLDPTVPKLSSESGPIVDPRQVHHSPQKPANDSQTPISPFSPSPLVDVDLVREMLDAMESRARARERRIGDLVQEVSRQSYNWC